MCRKKGHYLVNRRKMNTIENKYRENLKKLEKNMRLIKKKRSEARIKWPLKELKAILVDILDEQ